MRLIGNNQPQFHSLKALLLEMGRARAIDPLLSLIVERLAGRKDVALAVIWLVRPGDICDCCAMRSNCPDRTSCLHLAASADNSLDGTDREGSRIDGELRRVPPGVGEIGRMASNAECLTVDDAASASRWIVRPGWIRGQRIRSFGGGPLRDGDEMLGVLAVFTRVLLDRDGRDWLQMISDHAAAAIVNARAFEELKRRNRTLELENASRRGDVTPVESGKAMVLPDAELRRREKANVVAALEKTAWKIYGPGGAADLLGVKPTTLASRVRKMGLWKGARPQ